MRYTYIFSLLACFLLTPLETKALPTEKGMKLKTTNIGQWNLITRTDYEYDPFDDETTRTSFTVWLKPNDKSTTSFSVDFMCDKFDNMIGLYAQDSFFFSIINGATIDFKNEHDQSYSFSVERSLNKAYQKSIFVPEEDEDSLLEILKDSHKGYFRFNGQSGKNIEKVDFHNFSKSYDMYTKQCKKLALSPEIIKGRVQGICPNGCDKYFN
ncbi:hypothetical protein [Photobacterium damselae]|uniref:Uncharacterized protein n=2 Tax=Photobacterium damselae TaxID=38293 RepID=D0YVV6_PHODD|nr:hypothetical protein [Photobacterium damselae]EEZ41005.1 hypothetical protein VDA_002037 [Photobacterium damselae subsp. damselae CIP 102761]PSW81506.1 hypothetical protein CTN07_18910 [Photobacterium damselae]SPY28307.1 Uncharacterised protein [Photobacterium damselae]